MGSQEGSSKSSIPKSVLNNLVAFNKALGEVEAALAKHIEIDFSKHINERNVLDLTKIDLMSVSTLTSLAYVMSLMRGQDPENNAEIRNELNRSEEYSEKLKMLQDRRNAPRLNTTAAKNFIRNALWEIPRADEEISTKASSSVKRQANSETSEEKISKKKKY